MGKRKDLNKQDILEQKSLIIPGNILWLGSFGYICREIIEWTSLRELINF
jgi:hypothetical protein